VQRHEGSIEVESEVDRGSRFTIHLPLRQQREKVTETVMEQAGAAVPV
jgi:signal transduction histidine kinase